MKQNIFFLLMLAVLAGSGTWLVKQKTLALPATAAANAPVGTNTARKILYYQSPMHPWIKSDKPGKCPICGMNLVPVYASDDDTNSGYGLKLNTDSVNVADIRTTPVQEHQIVHSLHVAGMIQMNGPTYFVFTAYERDFIWLDVGQPVEVTFPSMPGKIYHAKITHFDLRFADPNRADFTHGIQVRAKLSDSLTHVDGIKRWRPFDGFYAEGRVIVDTPEVLAVPRSAVLSPNGEPFVYVDTGGGRYEQRKIKLGRLGDDYAEVLGGLKQYESIVTSGALLIDSEAQISQSADN